MLSLRFRACAAKKKIYDTIAGKDECGNRTKETKYVQKIVERYEIMETIATLQLDIRGLKMEIPLQMQQYSIRAEAHTYKHAKRGLRRLCVRVPSGDNVRGVLRFLPEGITVECCLRGCFLERAFDVCGRGIWFFTDNFARFGDFGDSDDGD